MAFITAAVAEPRLEQLIDWHTTEIHRKSISTCWLSVNVAPHGFVRISVVVYVPTDEKECEGLARVEVLAAPDTGSPKSH